MLEHYVLFAAAEGREVDLETALEDFSAAMTYNCPALQGISWGRNTNQSGLQRGFTHGCLTRIDPEGFTEYWDHPAHQRLLGQLDELCSERFAMDYRSGTAAETASTTPSNMKGSTR